MSFLSQQTPCINCPLTITRDKLPCVSLHCCSSLAFQPLPLHTFTFNSLLLEEYLLKTKNPRSVVRCPDTPLYV